MKLLLYCTKAKPYLYKTEDTTYPAYPIGYHTDKNLKVKLSNTNELANLNGKIVAECDFEVEKIRKGWGCLNGTRYFRNNMNHYYPDYELEKQSYLSFDEINKYLKGTLNENCGYAIHIKNLHIFDKPKELSEYLNNKYWNSHFGNDRVSKAPQNMMRVYKLKDIEWKEYILISIRPEWLCKILNKEKTIEIRKKVLKEMLKNE